MQPPKSLTTLLLIVTAELAIAEVEAVSLDTHLSYGHGSETDQFMQAMLELTPAIELSVSKNTSLVASSRIRLDARDELEPGEPTLDTYATAARPITVGESGTAELRDFFLEVRSPNGIARLGKQQIVWGRLDGIKVLDLINPQSFREFVLDDFGDARIGQWSAYFDYSVGNWRTELAIIADGTGHEIPESGAWFELGAPRFRFGTPAGTATPPVYTDTPGHTLDDTGLGLRLSRAFGRVQVSGVAYTGLDPEPLGRAVRIGGNTGVERYYERREALGFSAETGFDAVVLRAEYAYQPDRAFNRRAGNALDAVSLDQHRGAIAIDINAPLGLFLNAQYLVDSVRDAPTGIVRPHTDRVGTLYLRRSFAYDAITLEGRWYHSFSDGDDLAAMTLKYELHGGTSIAFAIETFSGPEIGLFGQFSSRDRIVIGLEHTF